MKSKKINVIKMLIISMIMFSIISASTYVLADPNSSHGFADFDENTAAEQANKELQDQETTEQEDQNKSSNNYLSNLKVKNLTLKPEFDKQTINYDLGSTELGELEIEAIPEDSRATVNGTGKTKLEAGENDIKIEVTAENGTVRTYHIKINKNGETAESSNAVQNEEVPNQNQENTIKNEDTQTSNKNTIACIIIAVLIIAIIIFVVKKPKKRK